jgi:hypothetical protein
MGNIKNCFFSMNISCPTSNIPTMIRPNTPYKQKQCKICDAFLHDWLQIPLVSTDYFFDKIHGKRLVKFSHEFVNELFNITKRITPLIEYMMVKTIHRHMEKIKREIIPEDLPLECIPECIWQSITYLAYYKTFEETAFKNDLDYICIRLEEEGVIKRLEFVYEFIGYCLQHIMNTIPFLHQEHMGTKEPSYAGPPLGMKINLRI